MRHLAFWLIAPIAVPLAAVLFVGTLALIWMMERWLPLNPRFNDCPRDLFTDA